MAYSHFRIAQTLISEREYAFAITKLYYAAFFAAQAACLEHGKGSKKHKYWVGLFNKTFGKGRGWVPKSYTRLLNQLFEERDEADYDGTLGNDEDKANKHGRRVHALLIKVRANTPLLLYPEFIEDFLEANDQIIAVEFDYYCPKSYIHKERVQFQIQAEKYNAKYLKKIVMSGHAAIITIGASRSEDYVVGWNNRLGQSGDGYLLFLDIDELDEGKVKSALKDKRGWLFKSGNGFHFIGKDILSSQGMWLHRFKKVAKSKKLKSLVDDKHVDFSIRRGYSTLRMSKSVIKDFLPFMCWDNSK